MSLSRPIQWYHFEAGLIWPEEPFEYSEMVLYDLLRTILMKVYKYTILHMLFVNEASFQKAYKHSPSPL